MEKNNKGRPTKYDPDVTPGQARAQAMDGHGTIEELAAYFQVHRDTICDWKRKYSDFSDSIKRPNSIIDNQVEQALLKRALGFETEETEIIATMAGKTTRVRKITRTQPPDTTACIYWLKNRKPEQWREKPPEAGPGATDNSAVDNIIAAIQADIPDTWADEEPDEEPEIDMDPGIDIED